MPTARLSTTTREGYGDRCTQAATELHQAGYTSAAAMEQLGTVTLLYDSGSGQAALARQLQQMWRETLGLQVTLQGVSNEEYPSAPDRWRVYPGADGAHRRLQRCRRLP